METLNNNIKNITATVIFEAYAMNRDEKSVEIFFP